MILKRNFAYYERSSGFNVLDVEFVWYSRAILENNCLHGNGVSCLFLFGKILVDSNFEEFLCILVRWFMYHSAMLLEFFFC